MKANEKLADVKMERDLFGSILFMSLQHQIDEQRIVATDPGHVDVTIVDGMVFLHLLEDPPMLLGDISIFILRKVCRIDSNEIHLVFDRISSLPSKTVKEIQDLALQTEQRAM